MPLYTYRCHDCKANFDRVLPLARYREGQTCPSCGAPAEKQLAAPAVRGDYQPYQCPVSGKIIEGRRAHEENLRLTGCRVLEPGEREAAARYRASEDTALDAAVDAQVEEFLATAPETARTQLLNEVAAGASAEVVRV